MVLKNHLDVIANGRKFDSVINKETITAVGDLDKNTAGATTRESPNTHTQKTSRMSTCCQLLATHQKP